MLSRSCPHQYINILVVCACVRDGCGRGNSLNYCYSGHSELNATRGMPSWALAIVLATDKNTRSFAVLNQKEIRFFTYVSACRGRGSHRQDERLAWVASRGQGTSCSSSFVSKVLGANYKSLEESKQLSSCGS